ncbi:efflux RND transporter periplasmic adaptor subunit [Desulfurivibrio sp. D14AmB]|uniref:efflux RND transporter periplasmic adaptor subunit n=1 Tax=Desulfurivibrio sp. D14AmB TaxID=3374370 RepID=UPI00376F31E5
MNSHRFVIAPSPATLRLLLLLGSLLLISGCGNGTPDGGPQGPPPMPVAVLTVEPENIAVEAEYAGRVHGSREVEVRARVAGILEKRLFLEGQAVAEGDPLFRIDPEPFAIAMQRARAEQAAAKADLEQARREMARSTTLYQQDAISQRERDQALTNHQLAEARLALVEAALADAGRNLRYTRVEAPITGITGLESFPEGSLIEPGTLLTTITSHDPIHLRFSLPEEDAARLARRLTGDEATRPLAATLRLADGSDYRHSGRVDFTDRVIDPRTGTVNARAIFANPDSELVPGQLLRIRLQLDQLAGVFAVPPAAISNDRTGPKLFVVEEDNTVRSRPVELGPQVAGRQLVLSGLARGDRLVINGQVALADGMAVNPVSAEQKE